MMVMMVMVMMINDGDDDDGDDVDDDDVSLHCDGCAKLSSLLQLRKLRPNVKSWQC